MWLEKSKALCLSLYAFGETSLKPPWEREELHSQEKVVCSSFVLEKSELSRKPLLPLKTFPFLVN